MKCIVFFTVVCLLTASFAPVFIYAQDDLQNNPKNASKDQLFWGDGILSGPEVNAWKGVDPFKEYTTFPSSLSGAIFIMILNQLVIIICTP